MLPSTQRHLGASRRLLQRLRHYAAAGGAAAVVLAGLAAGLASAQPGFVLLALVLLAYLASQVHAWWHAHYALRQLRLEALFVQQRLASSQLRRCLRETNHLWSRSRTLDALRQLVSRPDALPTLLAARARRAQQCFRRAYAVVHPWLLHPSLVFVLAVLPLLGVTLLPSAAPLALLLAAALLAAATLALEGVAFWTRRRLRRELGELERALGLWTATRIFYDGAPAPKAAPEAAPTANWQKEPKPSRYEHTQTYRPRPEKSAPHEPPQTPPRPTQPVLPQWNRLDSLD